MDFTPEQLAKAKAAKSAEELFAYAKEIGYALTEEEAKAFFEMWHKEGELADEELENVSGGSTCINGRSYSDDFPRCLITTKGNTCSEYIEYGGWSREGHCISCAYLEDRGGIAVYCRRRTIDHDDLNSSIGNGFNPV